MNFSNTILDLKLSEVLGLDNTLLFIWIITMVGGYDDGDRVTNNSGTYANDSDGSSSLVASVVTVPLKLLVGAVVAQ